MVEKNFDRDLDHYKEKVGKYLEICAHYYRCGGNIKETAAAAGVSRDLVYRVVQNLADIKNEVLIVDLRPIKLRQKDDTK